MPLLGWPGMPAFGMLRFTLRVRVTMMMMTMRMKTRCPRAVFTRSVAVMGDNTDFIKMRTNC